MSLDFIEQRMLDTLTNAPQDEQDDLAALAANLDTADLVRELQARYPKYANYFTPERVENVMAAFRGDEQDQDDDEPDTGPVETVQMRRAGGWKNLLNPLNWIQRGAPHADPPGSLAPVARETPQPEQQPDDFTRQRRAIEQFSEDYMPLGKRILHAAARLVGYVLPFLAVVAVGSDLGAFYAPGLGKFSSYLLSYAIECAIAGLTVVLGTAMASPERSTSHKVKLAITALVWLLCEIGSALSLYVMAVSVMSTSVTGQLFYVTIGWRVASTAVLDLASVAILFWTGKSLQRYLMEMQRKQHAIVALSDAEIDIKRAMQRADLRQQEDAMEMRARELRAAHLLKIDEVRNAAELERLRIVDSYPPQLGISSGNGRAYSGWNGGATPYHSQSQTAGNFQQNEVGSASRSDSAHAQQNATVDLDIVLPAMLQLHPDWTAAHLAKSLGVSTSRVYRWKQSHNK